MAWSILGSLKTETIGGVQNVVIGATWQYGYTNGEIEGYITQDIGFTYNPSSPFIQYSDLTEETVVGWVKSTLGADAVSYYETELATVTDTAAASEDPPRKIWHMCQYSAESDQAAPWAAE